MPGRNSDSTYRFGFNQKENLDDVKGEGKLQDFGARVYDPRIGRWYAREPLANKYPMLTPYSFCNNNPLLFIDADGKDWFVNTKTGLIIFIKDASEVKQEFFDKIKWGADIKDFERLGPNDMFGEKVFDAYGRNMLEQPFVHIGYDEQFANARGYQKAEKVKIAEVEYQSGGRMGHDENINLVNSELKQIGEAKITYVKPEKLNVKEILLKEEGNYRFSSFKKTLYNLTKPYGQDNRKTAEYYSNRTKADPGKLATFIDRSIHVVKSLFKDK